MQTITGDHDVRSKPGAGCFGTAASAEGFEDEWSAYRKAPDMLRLLHEWKRSQQLHIIDRSK